MSSSPTLFSIVFISQDKVCKGYLFIGFKTTNALNAQCPCVWHSCPLILFWNLVPKSYTSRTKMYKKVGLTCWCDTCSNELLSNLVGSQSGCHLSPIGIVNYWFLWRHWKIKKEDKRKLLLSSSKHQDDKVVVATSRVLRAFLLL